MVSFKRKKTSLYLKLFEIFKTIVDKLYLSILF